MTDPLPTILAALREREEAEPVAWMYQSPDLTNGKLMRWQMDTPEGWTETPLYAHPPSTHAARLEGARLVQEAASKICAAQYPHLVRDEFASGREAGVDACLTNIEALDPTKIIEEADNARNAS